MVLVCEEQDHELKLVKVGDQYDTFECIKCGQLQMRWV